MGETVQVRDLDSDIHEQLRRAAQREGMSLSAFLRRELTSLADSLAVRERARGLDPTQAALGGPFPALSPVDSDVIARLVREDRDGR